MRRKLRRWLVAAALTVATVGTSLVAVGPASAGHTACPTQRICLYQHINFNHDRSGWMVSYHISEFYACDKVGIPTTSVAFNAVSSVYNNTSAHLELWDIDSHPDFRVGTAMRWKGYGYLGARGNDATDLIMGVGCKAGTG